MPGAAGDRRRSGARRIALLSASMLSATFAVAAAAEGAETAQPATPEAVPKVEQVIVTARRREENLAKVPAVVTALSGAQLEERHIVQQTDLQTAVPGLTVRQTESNNYLNYVIRGQTVDNFSGAQTAVVPYVNEVQFAPGGASSFFDLQSIQVLKGPQGTLFGRNATGGAVLVTTAQPVDALAGSAEVSGGSYGYFDGRGMLNVPIVQNKVLLRVAFDVLRRSGFQKNVFTDQTPGALNRNVGRLSLTLRPVENLENTAVFQAEASGGTNAASRLYSYNRCGQVDPQGVPLNCSVDFLFGPQLDANLGAPGAWAAYLAAHPGANPGGIAAALAAQQNLYKFWTVDEFAPVAHRGRNWFVTNTTTYDLGEGLTAKNIFGASRSRNSDLAAEVGAPYLILQTYNALEGPPALGSNSNDEIVQTISEEPQLQGKAIGGALEYIVGAYYQRTRSHTFYPATYTDVSPIIPPTASDSVWKQTDTTKALYGHFTYNFESLRGLTADGGVRYSWEDVTSDQLPGSRFFPAPSMSVSFHKPSWNVGLQYQVNPDLMLYVQHRGSWRSGGINGIALPVTATAAEGGSIFLPETAKDVEVGAKWSGEVVGKAAHLYLAAYNQWVENIQRAQLINLNGLPLMFTVNVPSAVIHGVELDSALRPAEWLQLGFVGAYTDATYNDNRVSAFGQNFFFGPYADSPKWTGTVYAQAFLPTPEAVGRMSIRVDIYGQTGFYISNTADTRTPGTHLPGYSLTNFRFDCADLLGRPGVVASVFVRNAFNKGYYTGGIPLGDVLGVNSANVGEPRMWGAQVKYSF